MKVIRPTLEKMNDVRGRPCRYNREAAVKLLAMIAAHESRFTHREQILGPALSYYQIEPDTLDDLYENYLAYRGPEKALVDRFKGGDHRYDELRDNDAYATCVARLILWRVTDPLPDSDDHAALAAYAKAHWNTRLGKATPQKYLDDARRFLPRLFS